MNKKSFEEIYMGIRRDWNGLNPVTKIIPNKKKYNRKRKHKNADVDQSADSTQTNLV